MPREQSTVEEAWTLNRGGKTRGPDGRFLINTELDSAAAPITQLMNWHPEGRK